MSLSVFNGDVGYEGRVTLTLKNNNHILKSKTYKNKGTTQLFKFLGLCLTGSFEEAKLLLPNKILLLYNSGSPLDADPKTGERCTTWQHLKQTPTIINESKDEQVKVTFNFEVPQNAIIRSFNQVALYGASAGDADIKDFAAFHYLTDSFGAFDTQNPKEWSATAILLVEWELSLSNKNTEAIS